MKKSEKSETSETKIDARVVATAIVRASRYAGRSYDADGGIVEGETDAKRVENLLREHPQYGAYVVDGDPGGWDESGRTPVTIYMELKTGGGDDCVLPLDYYGEGTDESAMDVSIRASGFLPGHAFIEFVNAAVAVVVPE